MNTFLVYRTPPTPGKITYTNIIYTNIMVGFMFCTIIVTILCCIALLYNNNKKKKSQRKKRQASAHVMAGDLVHGVVVKQQLISEIADKSVFRVGPAPG